MRRPPLLRPCSAQREANSGTQLANIKTDFKSNSKLISLAQKFINAYTSCGHVVEYSSAERLEWEPCFCLECAAAGPAGGRVCGGRGIPTLNPDILAGLIYCKVVFLTELHHLFSSRPSAVRVGLPSCHNCSQMIFPSKKICKNRII